MLMCQFLICFLFGDLPSELILRDQSSVLIGDDYAVRGNSVTYRDHRGDFFLIPLRLIDMDISYRRVWRRPPPPPPPPPPRVDRVPWDHPAFRDKKAKGLVVVEIHNDDMKHFSSQQSPTAPTKGESESEQQ